MGKLYKKEDLLKLKASKPVPIIAHSGEVIVPVVYSGMVKKYLEGKGVTLPLTHHQLADMKREAKAIGVESDRPAYARGGKVKVKAKATAKAFQVQKANQNVIINLAEKKVRRRAAKRKVTGGPGGSGPPPPPPPGPRPNQFHLHEQQLRPNVFASIRPFVQGTYQANGALINQRQQDDEEKKIQDRIKKSTDEAIAKYKEEASRPNQLAQLFQKDAEEEKKQAPLRPPDINVVGPPRLLFPIFNRDEQKQDNTGKIKKLEEEIDELKEEKLAKESELIGKDNERKRFKSTTLEYMRYRVPMATLRKEISVLKEAIQKKELEISKL